MLPADGHPYRRARRRVEHPADPVRRQSRSPISTSRCSARSSRQLRRQGARSRAGRSSACSQSCSAPSSSTAARSDERDAARRRSRAGSTPATTSMLFPEGDQQRRQARPALQQRAVRRRADRRLTTADPSWCSRSRSPIRRLDGMPLGRALAAALRLVRRHGDGAASAGGWLGLGAADGDGRSSIRR